MIHYTVAKGDSLWQIAQAYNITLDDLLAANPQITDANLIMAGSVINIPQIWEPPCCDHHGHRPGCHHYWDYDYGAMPQDMGPALPPCGQNNDRPCIYQANEGETLESIARRFMVPLSQMIYHNLRYGKKEPLGAGSRIIIPHGAGPERELPPAYESMKFGRR